MHTHTIFLLGRSHGTHTHTLVYFLLSGIRISHSEYACVFSRHINIPTSSTRSLLSFDTTRSCMTKISAEPPCVADQSIPINSHKCEEEKVSSEGKIFLCFFSFLISLFPYAHPHGLLFPSLSTRTRFVFGRKKYYFLPVVMPTHTILFFPYYTHA